jgi:DNA-binding MarR family transcriptional regulator
MAQMNKVIATPDPLAEVRYRAPDLSGSGIDYGLLLELTGFSMKLTCILVEGLAARELDDPGITPLRFSILEVIGRNPGLQQMQLASALALSRPATTLELDFWENRGCIERRTLAEDRRSFGVYPTKLGMQELERLGAILRHVETIFTSQLTASERTELRRLLKKIHL